MKINLQRFLMAIAVLLLGLNASAYDGYATIDDIYYKFDSATNTATVADYFNTSNTGAVTIPETVTYNSTTYTVKTIGNYAFYNCSGLTAVTIPNSVTSIGSNAFDNCAGLTSVTIPNSVTSIGEKAFVDCSGLTIVNFNAENCTSMGSSIYPVFKGCSALTTLTIGENVRTIPDYAFRYCDGLTSVAISSSVTIIGSQAFQYCYGLTSVTIPNSVTSIGNNAFGMCSGLTSVTIGNSVVTIGNDAFHGCSGLTSITIPNSVTSIGSQAFGYCSGLTSVSIPNSVTSISSYTFYGCWCLTSITIPDTVTSIGECAFCYCSGLTSMAIPNSVTSIGSQAFGYCNGLTSITIGNSVTTIGDKAFIECTGLTSVTIPNSVTNISYSAFCSCTGLTSVNFNAENCTTMGSSEYPVFQNCSALTTLIIGENVKTIPDYAFYGCSGLTSISTSNSVTSIGYSAFANTGWYNSRGDGILYLDCYCLGYKGSKISGDLILKIGTILIAYGAFEDCTELTSVSIPNSVTSIGNSAFSGCSGLKSVDFNAENCTTMGSSDCPVFENCSALTTLTIGEKVVIIPDYTFKSCSNLTTVNFNAENCTTIGRSNFSGCTALATLTVGNKVKTIPDYAFYGCSNLNSVTIPSNVSTVGEQAFYGCTKLVGCDNTSMTQTTATLTLSSVTGFTGLIKYDGNIFRPSSGNIKITGLKPATKHTFTECLDINGNCCEITTIDVTTSSLNVWISESHCATSVTGKGHYTEGDVTILEYGMSAITNDGEYNGIDSITIRNLDPKTSYKLYFRINTKEGGAYSAYKSITTDALTWSNGQFTATSTTSARLMIETNCDATEGTGYEWKRYDAPDDLTPNKAPCPVIDGSLIGSLRGLNQDVYYKCRPYYTSSAGNTYYGDWMTIFTGDANVYFEPEVRTFEENTVVDNSISVKGYVLAGSDDITEQGFEYWKTGSTSVSTYATTGIMTVKASGISMSATITGLDYDSTYRYRAYAKTGKGTVYGSEVGFATGGDPAGVEYVEAAADAPVEVARYDMHGRLLTHPSHGINIVKYSDGTTRKEFVRNGL